MSQDLNLKSELADTPLPLAKSHIVNKKLTHTNSLENDSRLIYMRFTRQSCKIECKLFTVECGG